MPQVTSSVIRLIDYNERTAALRIIFHETGSYTYYAVPKSVYQALLCASSKGRFFNEHIRDRYPSS
jgi:hypothetical protein